MPAKSRAQQRLMAIAKHSPEKVYSKNKEVLKMKKNVLSEFAETPIKTLPKKVEPKDKVLNKLKPAAGKVKKKKSKYDILNKLRTIVEGKGSKILSGIAKNRNPFYVGTAKKAIEDRKKKHEKTLKGLKK